jgi:hypothetical protein
LLRAAIKEALSTDIFTLRLPRLALPLRLYRQLPPVPLLLLPLLKRCTLVGQGRKLLVTIDELVFIVLHDLRNGSIAVGVRLLHLQRQCTRGQTSAMVYLPRQHCLPSQSRR